MLLNESLELLMTGQELLSWSQHPCQTSREQLLTGHEQMKGQYKVASPGLRPLWEEAMRLAGRLDRFEMRHTLRGGNKEADQLANEAMDRGMGRPAGGAAAPQAGKPAIPIVTGGGAGAPRQSHAPAAAKPPRQVLEGYVKNGVVHLLEGELPDGIFVKVIKE